MRTETLIESQHITGRVFNRDAGTIEQMKRTRTIPFIASTADKDRHGSILNQENWDLVGFKLNPVIGYQHQLHPDMCIKATPDDVIGKGMNIKVERNDQGVGMLFLDIWFETEEDNPQADKVFKKLLNGTLNAVSVGFYPILVDGEESRKGNPDAGEDGTADYMFGQELLEISVVNIPSNKFALQKAIGDTVANALKFCKTQLNKSLIDIEKMTVGEVVQAIQGKRKIANQDETKNELGTTVSFELTEEEIERMTQIKKHVIETEQSEKAAEEVAGETKRLELELMLKRRKLKLKL